MKWGTKFEGQNKGPSHKVALGRKAGRRPLWREELPHFGATRVVQRIVEKMHGKKDLRKKKQGTAKRLQISPWNRTAAEEGRRGKSLSNIQKKGKTKKKVALTRNKN